MFLRPAKNEDAPDVAFLIMEAMSDECCAFYYGPNHTKDEFHQFMEGLVRHEDTQYSYRNAWVAEKDGKVVGIAVSYDGAQLARLREAFIIGMQERFGRDFSQMDDETEAGELYLDSFAVAAPYRRRGIGTALLKATGEKARALGLPCVGLLVDDGNPKALRLYEECGFRQVGTNTWGGHSMKHLQLPV